MFVWYEKENMRFPVKIWLEKQEDLEDSCREQAYHLAQLPFLHQWACLMPDTHAGKGMPIGGVIAADGVIIPNAVGVDIGSKHDIHVILQALADKGMAVIIVSDDLPEILENCSRVMVLRDGRMSGEFLTSDASEKLILDKMM